MPVSTALVRAATGLLQGGALYLLYRAGEAKAWPATEPMLFAALVTAAMIVPLILIIGLGQIRPRTLAAWLAAALALCLCASAYDIFRDPVAATLTPRVWPGVKFYLAFVAVIFILHALVAAGDADRKPLATYPRYFDVAWTVGVRAGLAVMFVGTFWLLLWLGASLFALIRIELPTELLKKPWFNIPATTITVAIALHVTDMRAGLVAGARALALTLLSWLLPVMTLISVTFLLTLPFTGLDPLWSTRRAALILLGSAAALVVLINTAYQDGQGDQPALLRWSRLLASLSLMPLVALAGYALVLRIQQYGLTPARVISAACVLIAACYAFGYAYAVIRSGLRMKQLETTNVLTSVVSAAVVLALLSPLADPARLSVADQLSRLRSGRIAPGQIDLAFLRFQSGRYGKAALETIAAEVPALATAARSIQPGLTKPSQPVTAEDRKRNISVMNPAGAVLPASFLHQDWSSYANSAGLPKCLTTHATCNAVLVDLDGDGRDEVILMAGASQGANVLQERNGTWHVAGRLSNVFCRNVSADLLNGAFKIVTPEFRDIEVAGQRLRVTSSCRP